MSPPPRAVPDYTRLRIRKSRRLRPLRRAVQFHLARGILAVAARLPVRASQRLGRATGGLAWHLLRSQRRLAETQLAAALPELDAAARRRIARECFAQFGMTLWETLAVPRIRAQAERWVRVEGEDALRDVHGRGRGAIVVTAHCGNWELLSVAFSRMRVPGQAIVRQFPDPRLNDLLLRHRRSDYLDVVQRGSPAASRQLLACLRRGDALILALDQDVDTHGVFVDFFGMPAHTPRVAATLALKHGVPVLTGLDERRADGAHVFRFREVAVPPGLAPDEDGVRALTQRLTAAIEAHVRAHPTQWAWNHPRWRRRPETERTA